MPPRAISPGISRRSGNSRCSPLRRNCRSPIVGGTNRIKSRETEASGFRAAEHELRTVRTQLQSTIDELETANEEMKSAAEEYQSVNEELQSTNEELETSKEEM